MAANRLSFDIQPFGDQAQSLAPVIDGAPLLDLVRAFESAHGMDGGGAYCGLVPYYFRFGWLPEYFAPDCTYSFRPRPGRLWVLGCRCGQATCWPLECEVAKEGRYIVWRDFTQPHRPGRDYTGLGPFKFAPKAYERVVGRLAAIFE